MAEHPLAAGRADLHDVAWVIRLATGAAPDEAPPGWSGIFEVAMEERCAALVWRRSGDFIRRHAPTAEIARWRACAVAGDAFVRVQRAVLDEVTRLLERRGIETTVLKGIPLALRLYGDAAARTTDDIDVLVRPEQRDEARRALVASGWRPHYSESLVDDCFVREIDRQPIYLELHGALVSELLSHVPFDRRAVDVQRTAGGQWRVLADSALPVYLAAHLAKHPYPYLLWYVDFLTLWASLSPAARAVAQSIADGARLSKWLRWAVERIGCAERVAEGDAKALRGWGFVDGGRCVTHGAADFVRNADTVADAARVMGALIWPRHLRGDLDGFATLSMNRLRARLSRTASTPRPGAVA